MKLIDYIVCFILMCLISPAFGQIIDGRALPTTQLDTITSLGVAPLLNDTIGLPPSSDLETELNTEKVSKKETFKISKDGLDEPIDFGSQDSSIMNVKENQIHLYGNAFVKYRDYNLKAGYIIFDFDKNEASAFRLQTPSGRYVQRPNFNDGTNKFDANGLRFNFKTKKGLIYEALTQEGEFTIHGSKTKFVSADSITIEDRIFNEDAIITTCTADHPHFGIRTRKLKVVPNKLAIMGVSQLEIMGIPTPLILPFGFFPLVEGRSNGLILPNNYEYNEQLGLGFREIGYYFPVNDYMDLRLTGDIYTRGSHRINALSQYNKRYKYNGTVQLSYANTYGENTTDGSRTSNKAFSLKVTHNQDRKAHPYITVGGNINLSTNRYDQTNSIEVKDVLKNKISSNFFYRHQMPGTPFTFSAALTHFQDNQTRKVNITLPDAKLRMNTIYPFKSKKGGEESWYELINVSYDANFKNYIKATDTTLFKKEVWQDLQTGLSHKANAGFNANVFKYFNFQASANAEQYVLTRILDKTLNPEILKDSIETGKDQLGNPIYRVDTTYGLVEEAYVNGLRTFEKFRMSANLNTTLFATKRFSKGLLRGIRHTMKPTLGFSFSPDTEMTYQDSVLISSDPAKFAEYQYYNPYRGGAFNPSFNEQQMLLNYRINNFFEGKYFSKQDSTEKKFKFLNALNVSGNYNFAADSLKFSPLAISGNTTLFKGVTNINFSAKYNFYQKNSKGRLINHTVWSKNKRPVEFDNFQLTVTNSLTFSKIRELIGGGKKKNRTKEKQKAGIGLADWVNNFRISHQFAFQRSRQYSGRDTSIVRSHSIRLSGTVPLTNNWSLSISNIQYDLQNNAFVYPQFSLSRDLHCWQMQFSWSPAIETYSFFIGVKSSTLSFLKYNYGQRNASRLSGFR